MKRRSPTLLTPDNPEWKRLSAEKRELLRPPEDASIEQLLRRGMQLSAEAISLQAAVVKADGGNARST